MNENAIAKHIVDVAFHIHQKTGPGLLESVYEAILARGLAKRGLFVDRQRSVPIQFEDLVFEEAFRADLVVNDLIIIEVKAIDRILAVHKRQLLTYLKLTEKRLGLLINFGEPYFKHAVHRVVNGLPDDQMMDYKTELLASSSD